MKSKVIKVSDEFKLMMDIERNRLSNLTGLNRKFFTNPIISKILANKLSGKSSQIKLINFRKKKKVIIE